MKHRNTKKRSKSRRRRKQKTRKQKTRKQKTRKQKTRKQKTRKQKTRKGRRVNRRKTYKGRRVNKQKGGGGAASCTRGTVQCAESTNIAKWKDEKEKCEKMKSEIDSEFYRTFNSNLDLKEKLETATKLLRDEQKIKEILFSELFTELSWEGIANSSMIDEYVKDEIKSDIEGIILDSDTVDEIVECLYEFRKILYSNKTYFSLNKLIKDYKTALERTYYLKIKNTEKMTREQLIGKNKIPLSEFKQLASTITVPQSAHAP